jgi:hypothetical protein
MALGCGNNCICSIHFQFQCNSFKNSSFQFDFLQIACLFPGIDFVTIWVFKVVVPIVLMSMFVFLYIFGVLRSIFAYKLGNAIMKKLGIRYKTPSPYLESMNKFQYIWNWIKRQFIYFYNIFVWIPRQGSTKKELIVLFNRTLNSFSAYISFIYIFIMTTASEIFVCTYQPNGMYTLNESPNIFWFVYF